MKGMIVSVYSNPTYRKCANGGPSEKAEELLLVGDEVPGIFEAGDRPIVVLKKKTYLRDYYYVEPIEPVPEGHNGYMMGGSFVYSSDSRFRSLGNGGYPLPVHDRSEVPSKY